MRANTLCLLFFACLLITPLWSQKPSKPVKVEGTGRTTAHVLNIIVDNTAGPEELSIPPGWFYIPGGNGLQGYLVELPEAVTIAPGETRTIPVDGYCADVHRPPVPAGEPMPDLSGWVPVGGPPEPAANDPIRTQTQVPVAPFSTGQLGDFQERLSLTPATEPVAGEMIVTWPGTDIPLGGTLDPAEDPVTFAALGVTIVEQVRQAAAGIQASGQYPTPFSDDTGLELEALTQQGLWITLGALTGDPYEKEDFTEVVYRQFRENTGREVDSLAQEARDQIDAGVDDFWDAFTATGVEAKVLRVSEAPGTSSVEQPECGCSYATLISIRIMRDGERVTNGSRVRPGTYQFAPNFAHDCPEGCPATIEGSWVIEFIPDDGGGIITDYGDGPGRSFTVEEDGRLRVRFRGTVYCQGEPCPYRDQEGSFPQEGRVSLVVDRCACSSCTVVTPMRIIDAYTGEAITEDSIPWYRDQLRFERPVVTSDCPGGCNGSEQVTVQNIPHYDWPQSATLESYADLQLRVWGPGYMDFVGRYACRCEGNDCGEGEDRRRIYLTESNDCCDRIRQANGGVLRFEFAEGSVRVLRNTLTLHLPPDPPQTFTFDFNLEAIFCNLSDDQVYSQLERIARQHQSGGNVDEFLAAQSLKLDHPSTSDIDRPYYSLIFMRTINGQETLIGLTVDAESCVFDLQVLHQGELHEHAGPPYLSSVQLQNILSNLGRPGNGLFWHRAMIVLSHWFRAEEYGQGEAYANVRTALLRQLARAVNELRADAARADLAAALNDLDAAVQRALISGDAAAMEQVLLRMIPVVNGLQ
jgi:hypothetical protein